MVAREIFGQHCFKSNGFWVECVSVNLPQPTSQSGLSRDQNMPLAYEFSPPVCWRESTFTILVRRFAVIGRFARIFYVTNLGCISVGLTTHTCTIQPIQRRHDIGRKSPSIKLVQLAPGNRMVTSPCRDVISLAWYPGAHGFHLDWRLYLELAQLFSVV